MRKIEQEMIQAVRDGENWTKGNTEVYNESYGICVFLENNLIGYIPATEGRKIGKFAADTETFRRFPTRTTASRLRALGVDARIVGGRATIDGKYI